MRILVTGLGGPAGTALARQIVDGGHTLIGTDIAPTPVSELAEEFHLGPRADDPALLPFLRWLATTQRADLLLPTVQDELPAVATAASLLGVPVVISEAGPVGLAHDKLLTAWHLAAGGVAVPRTAAHGEQGWDRPPYVVKPRVSRGGRGVILVEETDDAPGLDASLVIQEFAPGTEYSPQVYRSARTGESLVVVLEKTELKQGRVGNAVSVRRREDADDIARLAVAAVECLGLVGPVDMDVRRLEDGRPVVLEVNARFGANSAHAPELFHAVVANHTEWTRPVGAARTFHEGAGGGAT